jgi:hypothetical protein
MTRELQAVLVAAQTLPVQELPRLIGQLAECQATAQARLNVAPALPSKQHDELVDVAAASDRLGVSKDYLYRHAKELPFARNVGSRLLFSSLGIDAYIQKNSVTARQHRRTLGIVS